MSHVHQRANSWVGQLHLALMHSRIMHSSVLKDNREWPSFVLVLASAGICIRMSILYNHNHKLPHWQGKALDSSHSSKLKEKKGENRFKCCSLYPESESIWHILTVPHLFSLIIKGKARGELISLFPFALFKSTVTSPSLARKPPL